MTAWIEISISDFKYSLILLQSSWLHGLKSEPAARLIHEELVAVFMTAWIEILIGYFP